LDQARHKAGNYFLLELPLVYLETPSGYMISC
jgi:hypothetical protein